jgi:SAM-dependent methyltransferase
VAGDFRFHPFSDGQFGMIVMSNFLHAYGPLTARQLLEQSLKLLRPDGFVLIHDYMVPGKGSGCRLTERHTVGGFEQDTERSECVVLMAGILCETFPAP